MPSLTQPLLQAFSWDPCFDPDQWRATQKQFDRIPLAQDWAYGDAMTSLGADVKRFIAIKGHQPVAMAQVLTRRLFGVLSLSTCLRGPLVFSSRVDDKLAVAADLKEKLHKPWSRQFFVQQPDWSDDPAVVTAMQAGGLRQVMTGYSTAWLDLTPAPQDMRRAMKQKWRNALHAAERTSLSVQHETGTGGIDWLLQKEERQRGAARYLALPSHFVQAYDQAAAGAAVHLFTARARGERVAGMLFLKHGHTATYHIGWNGDDGRRLGAHNLLMWRAMTVLRDLGVTALDLGGLDSENSPGIMRFKLGTGAAAACFCGTWI